jgi:DNA-binding HxlR family transcriptional regulator
MSAAGITRQLWRLRAFGLLKKVAHSYRYYLTRLGRAAIAAASRLTEQIILPSMASTP